MAFVACNPAVAPQNLPYFGQCTGPATTDLLTITPSHIRAKYWTPWLKFFDYLLQTSFHGPLVTRPAAVVLSLISFSFRCSLFLLNDFFPLTPVAYL